MILEAALLSFAAFLGAMALPANAAPLTYSNNTNIYLSTPQITLVIKAGSVADGLTVNATSVALTPSIGGIFTLISPQALSYSVTGSGGSLSQSCSLSSGAYIETDTITQSSGSETLTFTPTGSACIPQHAMAGGTTSTPTPIVTLSIPNGGATYTAGQQIGISWSSADGAYTSFRVSYSLDNGNTWAVLSSSVSGSSSSYTWTVPTISTTQGLIKVEGIDSIGTVLALATSASTFIVVGTTSSPSANNQPSAISNKQPPAADTTVAGAYDKDTALANTPDINTNMGLTAITTNNQQSGTPPCASGTLIKGSFPAVYYCGADGKRHVFPNERVYFSWYKDFSNITVLKDSDLAKIPLGANVTYRPGSRLVKAQTSPKVYVVARGGVLRWLETEAVAARLYGADWNKHIDYITDAFFVNYKIGDPIYQ